MGSRDLGATVWQFTYTHNPYNFNESMIIKTERSIKNTLPSGTLHMELQGQVSFMPYPVQEFHASPTTTSKSQLTRLFIGQLPYQVTDMQLEWLCYTFGRGASVHYPERIVKKEKTNGSAVAAPTTTKIPTGCVHVYVEPDQVEGLFNAMHKRVLVDDTGVWYAQTDEECKALDRYTQHLKVNKKLRFQNRPYDSIVVQYAMSTFVPPPPTYNMTVHPQEGTATSSNHSTPSRSPQSNTRSSRGGKGSTSPPPPEYSVMNYAAAGAPVPLYPMQHEVMR